jgi:hypothetical protein
MKPRSGRSAPARASAVYFAIAGVGGVWWDEEHSTVMVKWDGWANSAEFQMLLDAEIKALEEHRGTRLLADCRRQRPLLPADLERADREWPARALAAGLTKFAVVLPLSDLAAMDLRNRQAKFQKSALNVQYFASPEEARVWLAG